MCAKVTFVEQTLSEALAPCSDPNRRTRLAASIIVNGEIVAIEQNSRRGHAEINALASYFKGCLDIKSYVQRTEPD